jgi:hypothetical protein
MMTTTTTMMMTMATIQVGLDIIVHEYQSSSKGKMNKRTIHNSLHQFWHAEKFNLCA